MKHIKTLIITFILPFMLLGMTGCSKEGDMSDIKVNDNKTAVYTVDAVQDDIYSNQLMTNKMIGKHKYTFETASDGNGYYSFCFRKNSTRLCERRQYEQLLFVHR